ncbi:MAG: zinc ribbon domain-containing protein YjdM [Acinetobacter sp.]|nr:zinc ribbon domain-containing protein YjdM [Acinetobacter sp.]
MTDYPNCPKCNCDYTYHDGNMMVCPECSHEWNNEESTPAEDVVIIKDANGQVLADGDSVTVVKDLKIKGSSQVVKVGTKVKNIRLLPDASDGHDIDCKIDGIGSMKLKSEFVKKV